MSTGVKKGSKVRFMIQMPLFILYRTVTSQSHPADHPSQRHTLSDSHVFRLSRLTLGLAPALGSKLYGFGPEIARPSL